MIHQTKKNQLNPNDLQFLARTDDNRIVPSTSFYRTPEPAAPFRPGAVVIATLANPREKFWGAILQLSAVGLSMRGVDLSSFDDFTAQIRDGEPFSAGVMFFPMHRVERLELDLPEGTLPSLAQRFVQKTNQDPAPILVSEFLQGSVQNSKGDGALHLDVGISVEEAERLLILRTLQATNNNKTRAAEILGISLKTLHDKLNEYGQGRDESEDESGGDNPR